ncbi:hypothetical protein BX600DRAFT_142718 [Xylariales sp. PMI_506]|nr:hypothetical protein BX600DRAFT_142718 [Xylariales sp. PMI_506]
MVMWAGILGGQKKRTDILPRILRARMLLLISTFPAACTGPNPAIRPHNGRGRPSFSKHTVLSTKQPTAWSTGHFACEANLLGMYRAIVGITSKTRCRVAMPDSDGVKENVTMRVVFDQDSDLIWRC